MTIAGVKKLIHDGKLPRAATDFQPTNIGVAKPVPNASADTSNDDAIDTALDLLKTAKQILTNQ